jgi:hypothetical protein
MQKYCILEKDFKNPYLRREIYTLSIILSNLDYEDLDYEEEVITAT